MTTIEIEFGFTEYDEHYNPADWFKGGAQTIYEAEAAETPEEAHKILLDAYEGADCEGVHVFWHINGVTYRSRGPQDQKGEHTRQYAIQVSA